MKQDELMKLPEVASRLKASVKTVRRRIASGELRAFKEGGRVCVLLSDFEEFFRRRIDSTSNR
ncbi:MAG: helix-turn-helix domain-containing protein [Verrucomicrobiae bacterium]|nr:helix-turn-helix domain-containing protein [Verrucomicrobiae bacterium]